MKGKKNKNPCKGCYVEIKKYTIFRGISKIFMVGVWLLIPIVNISLLEHAYQEGQKSNKPFYEGCFYDIEKVYVKAGKNGINI